MTHAKPQGRRVLGRTFIEPGQLACSKAARAFMPDGGDGT